MKNLLNDQDPLPKITTEDGYFVWEDGQGFVAELPESKRRLEEELKDWEKRRGEDWKPYSPGLEINGKGQLRTKDYKPPEPPEVDLPVVFYEEAATFTPEMWAGLSPTAVSVVSGFENLANKWVESHNTVPLDPATFKVYLFTSTTEKPKEPVWPFPVAEPQTQTAIQMERKPIEFWQNVNGERVPCDVDGWIHHKPGDPMPCDLNEMVIVKFKQWAHDGGPSPAMDWHWGNLDCPSDIVAWKPAT